MRSGDLEATVAGGGSRTGPEELKVTLRVVELENHEGRVHRTLPCVVNWYPLGDSNARFWLRRPTLYPLS